MTFYELLDNGIEESIDVGDHRRLGVLYSIRCRLEYSTFLKKIGDFFEIRLVEKLIEEKQADYELLLKYYLNEEAEFIKSQIAIYKKTFPPELTNDELEVQISAILEKLQNTSNIAYVLGTIKNELKGRADGRRVFMKTKWLLAQRKKRLP